MELGKVQIKCLSRRNIVFLEKVEGTYNSFGSVIVSVCFVVPRKRHPFGLIDGVQ